VWTNESGEPGGGARAGLEGAVPEEAGTAGEQMGVEDEDEGQSGEGEESREEHAGNDSDMEGDETLGNFQLCREFPLF